MSRKTWLNLSLLLGSTSLFMLIAKMWKVLLSTSFHPTLGMLYQALRGDIIFTLCLFLLFAAFLEARNRWIRQFGYIFLYVWALFFLVLTGLEHGYYLITREVGTWFLIKYSLSRLSDPGFIAMMRELAIKRIYLLLIPMLFLALPFIVARTTKGRLWLAGSPTPNPASATQQTWFTFFSRSLVLWVLVFGLIPPSLPAGLQPKALGQNYIWGLVEGAWNSQYIKEKKWKGGNIFSTQSVKLLPTSKTQRKNIVLIILESTRARSITPYNSKLPTTPFLDSIAKKSLKVERMHTVLPHTSKALVSILCGIYPKVTMEIVEGKLKGLPGRCLPKLLKSVGYQTAFFQTAMTEFEDRAKFIKNAGFHLIRGHESMSKKGFTKTNYFGYEDRMMLKPSLQWLDGAIDRKKPFFLSYLTLTSHHTYTVPPSFHNKKYTDSKDKELNKYLNALHYQDSFLRDLFKNFKRRGLMKNTIFLFVGDHGEAFGEHKRRQHDNIMWEEGLHVPAFIYSPSQYPKGKVIKGLRQQVDLLPTVFDLLKLRSYFGKWPGRSLLKPESPKRVLFFTCWYERRCLARLQGNIKFIHHYGHRSDEVYDLGKDPLERKNLAEKGLYTKQLLKQWTLETYRWKNQVNAVYNQKSARNRAQAISMIEPKHQKHVDARMGKFVRMVGFTVHNPRIHRGDNLEMSFVFQALRKTPRKWRLFFHADVMVGPPQKMQTRKFINADHVTVGGSYPLHSWKKGEYIVDRYLLHIPHDVPIGTLRITLGMWAKKAGRIHIDSKNPAYPVDKKKRLIILDLPLDK